LYLCLGWGRYSLVSYRGVRIQPQGKFKIPRLVAFMKGCVVLKQFHKKNVVLCCLPVTLISYATGPNSWHVLRTSVF
jgi:quinol-cytochrome oxidoreductase complex cytochrome b subunit